jgi:hypothetical protein
VNILRTIRRKLKAGPFDEQLYIARKYFFESGGNTEHLVTLLNRVDISLTEGTRQFIASVLSGQVKKCGRVKNKYFRDLNIYWSIDYLLAQGEYLTSSADKSGAASKIADMYGITEDAALQIYQRMKPKPPSLDDYI